MDYLYLFFKKNKLDFPWLKKAADKNNNINNKKAKTLKKKVCY